MAKSLMDQIEAAVDGKWLSKAQISAVLPDASKSSISGLLTHLIRRERLERRGEPRSYEYRRNTGEPAATSQPASAESLGERGTPTVHPNFAASLGVTCNAERAVPDSGLSWDSDEEEAAEPAVAGSTPAPQPSAVASMFDADVAMTLDELDEQSPYARDVLLSMLQEAVMAGELRSRVVDGVPEYYLVEAEELAEALTTPSASEIEREAQRSSQPRRTNQVGPPTRLITADLRNRLTAIALDIEDAIGDACDTQAPYEVIKALVVANSGTHRALRSLG